MKVTEVIANEFSSYITLESENPAELALLNLLNNCDAKLSTSTEAPSLTTDVRVREVKEINSGTGYLLVTATVKKNRY